MEFTAEHVEKAVGHFYQNLTTQSQLNMWLTSAQSSNQAWIFCWQLLDQSKSVEVQYFGASSLQIKISRFWHEIPPDQYTVLQEKLLSKLIEYAGGPKLVLTRLCLALSSLILHSIPDQWSSPLSDIIVMLQKISQPGPLQPQFVTLLLEILTVLPEEFQSMQLAHERRVAVRGELLKAALEVLPILNEVICRASSRGLEDDESASLLGIKCLSSWIQNGVGVGLEECIHLVGPLLAVTHNEHLSEASLDALTHLINHPEAHRYPNILMGMLCQLLSLRSLLDSYRNERLFERAAQIYAVYAAFGEGHSRLLLDAVLEEGTKKENVIQLVKILLESSETPGLYPVDECCSPLAFSFWYILQDDICASVPEKHKIYSELFSPLYLTLVDILVAKSMLVPNESSWSAEDKEKFRCYRQDIADTLAYCYKFLRSTMMERLASHLAATVANYIENPETWPALEACLHALKAVAENVEAEEDELVPRVLSLFGNIPSSANRHVISTALETLGAYAEWLSAHPVYLGHILPILLYGLGSSQVAPAATMALKDITRDCQSGIRPYAASLLEACEQALLLKELKPSEKIRLMYILGKVLSILPLELIVESLNRVVQPCVEDLQRFCAMEPGNMTKSLLITRLKMIATLCTTLDLRVSSDESDVDEGGSRSTTVSQQPVLLIAQKLLPFLKVVAERWGKDEQIIESICLVVKHTISTLMDESIIFLPDMATVIVECHRMCPQSATLEVAKLVLLMFGDTQGETGNLISVFLSEIIGTTLLVCGISAPTSPEHMPLVDPSLLSENSEVLASFLTLLAQLMKKTPQLLITRYSPTIYPLSSLFYCGIVGLTLPVWATLKSATSYLVHFITQSRESAELVAVVQNQGQILINQLLKCIGGESPRALVENMADVLLALSKKYFDSLCRWLGNALSQEGFPSSLVSSHQKENFCRLVLKERSNRRRLKEIVHEFSLHCRGLVGTEYSEQTSHIFP